MDLAELIERARQGDPEARHRLITSYYPAVRRMVHQELRRDPARSSSLWPLFSTSDICQEVFLSVVHDLDTFSGRDEATLIRYLSTLVRNRIVDALRYHQAGRRDARRHARSEQSSLDSAAEQPTPSSSAVIAEQIRVYEEILASLSARDRDLLLLRLERDESFAEIARRLDLPSADAARKAYHSARARLLVRLHSRGIRLDPTP